MDTPERKNLLIVVSGPAGSGKTTLCERACDEWKGIKRVITATTRPPRGKETDGIDYYFFSKDAFEKRVADNAFLEHARVHDRYYGTLKSEIRAGFESGFDLLLNIDVQGAATLREVARQEPLIKDRLVDVFVTTPTIGALEERLLQRGLDSRDEIDRRLKTAEREMKCLSHYQYCLYSSDKEADFSKFRNIYEAEKLKTKRYHI